MALNLGNVFLRTNTILKGLLNKYEALNIIGFDEDNNNNPYYIIQNIRNGFYYKDQQSRIGEVEEVINIVPENSTIEQALEQATVIELVEASGARTRFQIDVKTRPQPPSYQWSLKISQNKQDKRTISL